MNIGIFNRKVDIYAYQEIENEVGATEQQLIKIFPYGQRLNLLEDVNITKHKKLKMPTVIKLL